VHLGTTDLDVRLLTRRLRPGLGGYVLLVVLGLFLPLIAALGYLLIAFNLLVPGAPQRAAAPRDAPPDGSGRLEDRAARTSRRA
jgi:hypothetical protein